MACRIVVGALCWAACALAGAGAAEVAHLQGEMAGEVTATTVILQSRLTAPDFDAQGDVPGAVGVAQFEIASEPSFGQAVATPWLEATAENDYIVKARVQGLAPATKYFYRLRFGTERSAAGAGPTRSFATLPPPTAEARTSFVVVTGMNYDAFHLGKKGKPSAASDEERRLGYPALVAIRRLKPHFFVGTGDNVYYDSRPENPAQTVEAMRKKWHEQFAQPRYVDLWSEVPSYWEKDDHDYRYNDCDNSGKRLPSVALGKRVFLEQVPVVDPLERDPRSYRTHRVSRLLQIWLVEGRDYRSLNKMADGPAKTLWGDAQLAWLKRTLLASDAPVKVLISPTPLVGPDDLSKRDNHCNIGGFRHEGDAFFRWAKENGFLDKGLYLVCGDRHWQYHSIHPSGFEEFSTGALVDENARLGVRPGDPKGTDPQRQITQPFISPEATGGFLNIVVEPSAAGAVAEFVFYDDLGSVLHRVQRPQ